MPHQIDIQWKQILEMFFTSQVCKLISVAKQKGKMRQGGIREVESQNNYQAFKICLIKFKTKVISTLSS